MPRLVVLQHYPTCACSDREGKGAGCWELQSSSSGQACSAAKQERSGWLQGR